MIGLKKINLDESWNGSKKTRVKKIKKNIISQIENVVGGKSPINGLDWVSVINEWEFKEGKPKSDSVSEVVIYADKILALFLIADGLSEAEKLLENTNAEKKECQKLVKHLEQIFASLDKAIESALDTDEEEYQNAYRNVLRDKINLLKELGVPERQQIPNISSGLSSSEARSSSSSTHLQNSNVVRLFSQEGENSLLARQIEEELKEAKYGYEKVKENFERNIFKIEINREFSDTYPKVSEEDLNPLLWTNYNNWTEKLEKIKFSELGNFKNQMITAIKEAQNTKEKSILNTNLSNADADLEINRECSDSVTEEPDLVINASSSTRLSENPETHLKNIKALIRTETGNATAGIIYDNSQDSPIISFQMPNPFPIEITAIGGSWRNKWSRSKKDFAIYKINPITIIGANDERK